MEPEKRIGLAAFVGGVGLEVAGITVPYVGYALMAVGGVLFLHALWSQRNKIQGEVLSGPNFSIRDLFFHVDPGVLDDNDADHECRVGLKIKDKLAIGQLKAWGRSFPDPNSIETLFHDVTNPLAPIDSTYWSKADFSYRFFHEGNQLKQHTYPDSGSGLPALADIQVNKADAIRIWPKQKPLDANDNSIWWAFAVQIIFLLILAAPMALSDTSKAFNYAYPYLKRWVIQPIDPALGIEDALIRPYQSDPSLLEVGLEIKNVSDMPIHYRVQDFVISIDGDKRLYLTRKATDTKSLPQTMGTMLWFNPFSDVINPEQQFATFDVAIEYGPKKNILERILIATFSCDLVRGKQDSTDCMIKKESDDEIP